LKNTSEKRGQEVLPRSFYARPTISVAIDLLGKVLLHNMPDKVVAGKIVETEAYLGGLDDACHASHGKTQRTKIFWGYPGVAYVYVNYGIHYCLNVITEDINIAGCVLIRAIEPVMGISVMKKNRGIDEILSLTNGPGKLTQAMSITSKLNGAHLTQGDLVIIDNKNNDCFNVSVTTRIGISKATDEPLRFIVSGNQFVSRRNPEKKFFEGPPEKVKKVFCDGKLRLIRIPNN